MFRFPSIIFLATLALAATCPALTNTSPKSKSAQEKPAAPDTGAAQAAKPGIPAGEKTRVMVIEIREAIDEPVLYVLRRGLKEAEEKKIGVVILDMNTKGGRGDTTFEMMEALDKFSGQTLTYINNEAGSAGAFIAGATEEIWYAPKSIIGASAAVSSDGQEIPETMRLKINSFYAGKLRTYSEDKGRYNPDVLRAMLDKDFEFKIGDTIINPKGQLLTLTDRQALTEYGDPPQKLFGSGSARDINDLLGQKFGPANFELTRLEVTWSEHLARWLSAIKPLLLGLGVLALFIEFKTPGFGFFGIAGIVLLGIVFLSSYVAGLSGHEPMIVFAIGFILVMLELLFFPGVMVAVITGLLMMLGSLVWAMADFWPGDPISTAWTTDTLVAPLINLGIGLLIGIALILALLRFMPHSWFWDRIQLASEIAGAAQVAGLAPEDAGMLDSLIGRRARVVTPLRPFGQVEIDGKFYEARLPLGTAGRDTTVIVRGYNDFSLDVEPDADAPKEGNA